MTATEKQELAGFINIAEDFLFSGYKNAHKIYDFKDDEENHEIEEAEKSIEKIISDIANCFDCPLCRTRKNTVPGEGVLEPKVLVVGEGPGADEDEQGRPFVGKAGQKLDQMLASIDLSRKTNCYIANIVKCRPPKNRDPNPDETIPCAVFLSRQIEFLKPDFILCMGKISAHSLLKTEGTVQSLRHKFHKYRCGSRIIPLLVTYHPSALLRSDEYRRPAWEDLKMLKEKLNEKPGESENNGEN